MISKYVPQKIESVRYRCTIVVHYSNFCGASQSLVTTLLDYYLAGAQRQVTPRELIFSDLIIGPLENHCDKSRINLTLGCTKIRWPYS